jgi:hypothetical protein
MKKIDTKNIKAIWGVLCTSSSVDQESNNISLYKILERLTLTRNKGKNAIAKSSTQLESVAFPHEYVVLLQRAGASGEKETFPLSIRLSDPDGRSLHEASIPAIFEIGKKRLRIRIQSIGLPVTISGEYSFETLIDGIEEPLTTTPLEIVIN